MDLNLLRQSLAVPIKQAGDIDSAGRQAFQIGQKIGLSETDLDAAVFIAVELASNLVKHGGGGDLIFRVIDNDFDHGIELMSLDNGSGMIVSRCMEDGYSTAGGAGTGLGTIRRLATAFDAYSLAEMGSVLVARILKRTSSTSPFDLGALCLPIAGERYCGDAWAVREHEDRLSMMVSDGLGHGIGAAEASDLALGIFAQALDHAPSAILEAQHVALTGSIGAAVLTCRLDSRTNMMSCTGIGNVAGVIVDGADERGVVSLEGVVGSRVRKIKTFDYDVLAGQTLVFHSDGLTSRWRLKDFPGLFSRSAAVIAGVMFKTYRRGKDDATVLVVRRR